MNFLCFLVRKAAKAKNIAEWNLWKGKLTVNVGGGKIGIHHIDDLIGLGLATEDDRPNFVV